MSDESTDAGLCGPRPRGRRREARPEDWGECACGCRTRIRKVDGRGVGRSYVHGHNARDASRRRYGHDLEQYR